MDDHCISKATGEKGGRQVSVRAFAAADRGMAMAHVDGKVVFIPFAAPGDLLDVEIVRERRRYLEGRIVRRGIRRKKIGV